MRGLVDQTTVVSPCVGIYSPNTINALQWDVLEQNGLVSNHYRSDDRNYSKISWTNVQTPASIANWFQAMSTTLVTPPNIIPDTVIDMSYAFQSCSKMTSAPTIPNSVVNMAHAFYGCTSLTTPPPNIPSSVMNIWGCFDSSGITSPPSFSPGSQITNLHYAFSATRITSAPIIPNSVTDMVDTFASCLNLTTPPTLPPNLINMSGCFRTSGITTAPFIPSTVRDVGGAFSNCKNLTTFPVIPTGVTNMSFCFANSANMEGTGDIPYGVTHAYSTFNGCTKLYSMNALPNTILSLGECFLNSGLSVAPEIPASVNNLYWCFGNCKSLTSIAVMNDPSAVVNMASTYSYCTSLTEAVTLPTGANNFNFTFTGCNRLTTVVFPEASTSLFKTLRYCTNISSVTILSPNVHNIYGLLEGASTSVRTNVYVPAGSQTNFLFYESNKVPQYQTSFFGTVLFLGSTTTFAWTINTLNSCYYNTSRNIYVYYTL